MATVEEFLQRESFFDAAILRHGFTDYMRDYEIIVYGRNCPPHRDVHRYQFIGCVEAIAETRVPPRAFAKSLSDEFVLSGPDYPEKEEPEGFIWGVRFSNANPGLIYVRDGARAVHWSRALGRPMHEVTIETEAFHLRLVFADVRCEFLGHEDTPLTLRKDYPIDAGRSEPTSDGGVR